MSISGFIQRTKTKALNMAEARRNAVSSESIRKTEELGVKNAVLRADILQRENLKKAEAENKRLRMQKLVQNLPSFGNGKPVKASGKVSKVNTSTSFKSPFANTGFGGNSPFRADNLAKDSFGKGSMTGNSIGGNSPFKSIYSNTSEKKKAPKKKKRRTETIIVYR